MTKNCYFWHLTVCENIPKLFSAEGHVNLSDIQIVDFVGMNCKNGKNIKLDLSFYFKNCNYEATYLLA